MMRARNWRVRGSTGSPSTCWGGPISRTRPSSRNATLIGHLAREAHLVRGHHDRHALLFELAHQLENLADKLGVERTRHFVEQQQPRVVRERSGDRGALLLTAGKPVGVFVGLVCQPYAGKQLTRSRLRCPSRHAMDLAWRECHVVEHGHVREEVVRLEDDPDAPAHLVRGRRAGR